MTEAETAIVFIFGVIIFWGVSIMALAGYAIWVTRPPRDPKPRKKSPPRTRRTSTARRTSTRRPTA